MIIYFLADHILNQCLISYSKYLKYIRFIENLNLLYYICIVPFVYNVNVQIKFFF